MYQLCSIKSFDNNKIEIALKMTVKIIEEREREGEMRGNEKTTISHMERLNRKEGMNGMGVYRCVEKGLMKQNSR